jgi:hypothetical protein
MSLYNAKIPIFEAIINGSLTQLVQSVTSTTWKSLVRIQYDPHHSQSR